MATLTSSLIVSLLDRVSGPAKAIASSIRGIGAAVSAANNGGLAAMARTNSEALTAMHTRMLAATAAAYGLYKALSSPLSVAGQFESILLDIAQKSDLSDNAMAALGRRIREIAPAVNKTAREVAQGMDVLTSMGLDPTRALAITPLLGKAATAYRAEMSDVAAMTYAAIDNLKVPVSETAKLLDTLSFASKAGAFEFKDMARYFPSLAADAQAMGEKGVIGATRLAAALEIVRKGAGTSEEAARNLANVYQKAMSPETTKKFAKFGIDIRKELDKTRAEGGDLMEALATQTMKALTKAAGGDTTKALSRMGDIFEDAQAQKGMKAFIQNWAEYRRVREEALKAAGVVEEDFKRRMKTFAAQTDALRVATEDLGITIGEILIPPVLDLIKAIKPAVEGIRDFSRANPELVGGAIKAATALIGMSIAGRAVRWSFLFLKGGLLAFAQPALKAAGAIGKVAKSVSILPTIKGIGGWFAGLKRGFMSLLVLGATAGPGAAFKALGSAFLGLLNPLRFLLPLVKGIGVVLSPVGLIIAAIAAAIAAAGVFIYNNWKGLGAFFSAFGDAFMAAIGPMQPLLDKLSPAIEWLGKQASWLWEQISGLLGEISPATWASWGAAAGAAVGNLAVGIMELPGRIASLGEELYTGGLAWMGRMYDGVVQGFRNVVDFFASIPRMLFELGGDPGVQFYENGLQWMGRLWDGLKATAAEIIGWIGGVAEKIAGVFSGLGGKVRAAFGLEPAEEEKSFEQRIVDAHERRKKASNDNAPAPQAPKKRATLRIIGNPEDGAATEPAGATPGIEPSVMPTELAPRVDTSEVEQLKQSTGEARQGLADLNTTVRPAVDASGVAAFRRQVADAKKEFQELGMLAAGGLAGGGGLRAGGTVNRASRGLLSDYAHETGGG